MAEFVSATPRRRARQRRRIPKLNICYAAASQLAKDGGAENHFDFRCARSVKRRVEKYIGDRDLLRRARHAG
jgi:hypothetical protein